MSEYDKFADPYDTLLEQRTGMRKKEQTPLDVQVGGDWYKQMKIQPVQYIHANGLGYFEGCIIKYVSRHRKKNGAEDLRKVIHYAQLLLELEYGEK